MVPYISIVGDGHPLLPKGTPEQERRGFARHMGELGESLNAASKNNSSLLPHIQIPLHLSPPLASGHRIEVSFLKSSLACSLIPYFPCPGYSRAICLLFFSQSPKNF